MPTHAPVIKGLTWLSERIPYPVSAITGDTYPMTWGKDGHIYTSSGDPMWGQCHDDHGLDVERFAGEPPCYLITRRSIMQDFLGYAAHGPKPSGMISVGGKLYLAFQNLKGWTGLRHGGASQSGSDSSIIVSEDYGKTWSSTFTEAKKNPMFPGPLFGGPAFINFGQDNQNARDGYVYAVSTDQWDNGSELRLGRVPQDRILEAGAWQWVSRLNGQEEPTWSSQLEDSVPILTRDHALGLPDMVYLRQINRYVLSTWRLKKDFSPVHGTDLFLYEAPEPWGPFTLVYTQEMWEGQDVNPYCPRIPLKWLEADGLTGWMQFSGSWTSPHDREDHRPYYRSNVRKFRLLTGE